MATEKPFTSRADLQGENSAASDTRRRENDADMKIRDGNIATLHGARSRAIAAGNVP
jgi:hypothetical protein